jgi:large subunit ribosomal protein L3
MFIIGKKVKMTQIWKEDRVIPVTVISVAPNSVTLVRTKERDGYSAVQLASGKTKLEFRVKGEATLKVGDKVDVSVFAEGDKVKVSGTSKGRGFQGPVKRHGFHGGPQTHGQKNRLRAPGSIGSTAPQRVTKGRRMAGHMGTDRITLTRVKIIAVDAATNTIMLKGSIPGAPGGLITLHQ